MNSTEARIPLSQKEIDYINSNIEPEFHNKFLFRDKEITTDGKVDIEKLKGYIQMIEYCILRPGGGAY
jgi:hypothetical protein